MEIKIQSIHFDATDKLEAFIEKKVAKLTGETCHRTEQGGQHKCGCSWNDSFRGEDK